jgi:hypothetical protein
MVLERTVSVTLSISSEVGDTTTEHPILHFQLFNTTRFPTSIFVQRSGSHHTDIALLFIGSLRILRRRGEFKLRLSLCLSAAAKKNKKNASRETAIRVV